MLDWLSTDREDRGEACACECRFEGDDLVVDAGDCDGGGDLLAARACRGRVVDALGGAEVASVRTRHAGRERVYLDEAAALLTAAGKFAARVARRDERLAVVALRDPVGAAREATGRAGPVADVAEATGLAGFADAAEASDASGAGGASGAGDTGGAGGAGGSDGTGVGPDVDGAGRANRRSETQAREPADRDAYATLLRPFVGPTVSHTRVRPDPPADGRLSDVRSLPTGSEVRRYRAPGEELDVYHVEPAAATLSAASRSTLAAARSLIATGGVDGPNPARTAVERVASDGDPVELLARTLEKHTADLGVLVDCFADDAVSDVFANAPAGDGPLYVRVDGDRCRTNVRLTDEGATALASTLRLRSGTAFSRASPTLDATVAVGDRRVRVAGTTDPASDGLGVAFRARDRERWTLGRLVGNGTVPPAAAGLLATAVHRGAAALVAGPRGAGKTTLLGALLWELSPSVRTLVVEDTRELPVDELQDAGRDAQALGVTRGGDGPGLDPAAALRTALRLGEGALVVGEVRGEEAAVLYEAMRVGANGSAVLGTIHGDGAENVRERVVSDLGVPESSFGITDLVVTMATVEVGGERRRRVAAVEEVVAGADGVRFGPLFATEDGRLAPTGRVERGESRLVESLTEPGESYADVLSALRDRAGRFRAERATEPGGEAVATDGWPASPDANGADGR